MAQEKVFNKFKIKYKLIYYSLNTPRSFAQVPSLLLDVFAQIFDYYCCLITDSVNYLCNTMNNKKK